MGAQPPHSGSKKAEALEQSLWSADTRPPKASPLEEDKQDRKLSLKEQEETTGEAMEDLSEQTHDRAYEERHARANRQGEENLRFRIPL